MKFIRYLALLAIAASLVALAATAQAETDQDTLRAIDQARFLETDYVSEIMGIVAIRPGEPDQEAAMRISYSTVDDELFRLRIDYLAPEENVGQAFLILEDDSVRLCTPDLDFPWSSRAERVSSATRRSARPPASISRTTTRSSSDPWTQGMM